MERGKVEGLSRSGKCGPCPPSSLQVQLRRVTVMQVAAQLSWLIHISGTLGEESQRSSAVRSALGLFYTFLWFHNFIPHFAVTNLT